MVIWVVNVCALYMCYSWLLKVFHLKDDSLLKMLKLCQVLSALLKERKSTVVYNTMHAFCLFF